jgi:hypothetical protein
MAGVAAALAAVTALYRRPVETEDWIAALVAAKRLVLVDRRPRSLYWEGQSVAGKWDRWPALWDFLWLLAGRARRQQPVHGDELTRPDAGCRTVVNRRHRLGNVLPSSLDMLIEDVRPKAYQLKLDPDDIALLEVDQEEQLVEVGRDEKSLLMNAADEKTRA